MINLQDKIRGSLVGGAIGDALGYPVEAMTYAQIVLLCGERGITRYKLDQRSGKALISDGTQMTLFTACGLLNAVQDKSPIVPSICEAYVEWYYTQIGKRKQRFRKCWVGDLPEMNVRRAPGNTCINSLYEIVSGREPINNSKGCGGVMRIAPIPLYMVCEHHYESIRDAYMRAGEVAEITHQHPLGFVPAAFLSNIIYQLMRAKEMTRENFLEIIELGLKMARMFGGNFTEYVAEFEQMIEKAVELTNSKLTDVEAINQIGEGWTGDETVAIAVYCVLRHLDDFESAIVASVNHNGDSDSTGAVTGNIIGAIVGYDAIPQHFKENLELHDVILHMADDLWKGEITEYKRKILQEGLRECALYRAKVTNKTVFINRTEYSNAEEVIRELVPHDFNFDVFHTVIYIDYSQYFGVFELRSGDANFKIELKDADPEGNGIYDCEYLINGTTVHLWHDDFYLKETDRMDFLPKKSEKTILPIDNFGSFAQNLHLIYDRWQIRQIVFVPNCDIASENILIDTLECKAYGHLENHILYVTTSSPKFVLPEDMSYAFYGITRLFEIWGMEHLDTSRVTNMSNMFSGCSVRYLDLSGFNTSRVTNEQ